MTTPRKKSNSVRKRTVEPAPEIKNEKVQINVETPEPLPHDPDQKSLTPPMTVGEDPHVEGNRYAPKMKVGTPTLGRSPNYVTTVGLGNLKVTTVNGNTNV